MLKFCLVAAAVLATLLTCWAGWFDMNTSPGIIEAACFDCALLGIGLMIVVNPGALKPVEGRFTILYVIYLCIFFITIGLWLDPVSRPSAFGMLYAWLAGMMDVRFAAMELILVSSEEELRELLKKDGYTDKEIARQIRGR